MLISMVMTNHNYAEYLGDAIESAIDQDYPHTEVIVVVAVRKCAALTSSLPTARELARLARALPDSD